MEIRRMKLSDIKPAPYNPRKDLKPGNPEYDKMRRSIDEFDCVEPLVWNKRSQHLVGGHQRLKILKEKGVKEFEVSVVDLDEKRERALNIALNKIQGDWDFTKLADLMVELDDGEFDLELTGFDMPEIRNIMEWTPVDEKKEWEGMPEFNQEDKTAFRSIIVHFMTQEDMDKFSQVTGNVITEKTKSIWYPKKEKADLLSMVAHEQP